MFADIYYIFVKQVIKNDISVGTKFRLCSDMLERALYQVMLYNNRIKKAERLCNAWQLCAYQEVGEGM